MLPSYRQPGRNLRPGRRPVIYPGAEFHGRRVSRAEPALLLPHLIARIGNGAPFEVGTSDLVTSTATGVLYLGINDDSVSGNSGSFSYLTLIEPRSH